MKVTLTLNRGSFYFMKNVHLVKGVPTEVDLGTLDKVELVGLKLNVKGGTILAGKDIESFGTDSVQEVTTTVEPVEEVKEETTEVLVEEVAEQPVEKEAAVEPTEEVTEVVDETPKETPKKFNRKK